VVVPQQEVDRRVALYAQALREGGLRSTHQRMEVAREIAMSDTHPDVEAIYRAVRQRVPTISLDTVYRTVGTLERMGLVERVPICSGATRYDANLEHHHHFVCTGCGIIRDLAGAAFEELEITEAAAGFGRVGQITVQVRGLCNECCGQEQHQEEQHREEPS